MPSYLINNPLITLKLFSINFKIMFNLLKFNIKSNTLIYTE